MSQRKQENNIEGEKENENKDENRRQNKHDRQEGGLREGGGIKEGGREGGRVHQTDRRSNKRRTSWNAFNTHTHTGASGPR